MSVLVSVIVPNYNHAGFLPLRMQSILDQKFQDFEIIILDDCSTDNSREVLEQYRNHPKVSHLIYNTVNSGVPFKQWAKGIALAKGKYIWIAESDDYASDTFLHKLTSLAQQNANAGIIFSNSNWVNDSGELGKSLSLYSQSFTHQGSEELKILFKYNTIQNASAALIRLDLAKSCLTGIENFRSCGDWLFYIRILQHSDLVYTAEKLNNFRWYHNNTSSAAQQNDWWTIEGLRIISEVDLPGFKFERAYLSHLAVFWSSKIIRSPKLSVTEKCHCFLRLAKFYFKYVIP
jgi:glycosyltransferase involved in cell wall biosynthesis